MMTNRKATKLILLFALVAFLLLLPTIVDAANDVAMVGVSNSTVTSLTAVFVEYSNLSFSTGSGNTTVYLSAVVSTNSTQAKLFARVKRDGIVVESVNFSQSVFPESASFIIPVIETEGTHIYTFEAYCSQGKICTLYNRTFSAVFMKSGSFAASVTNVTASNPLTSTYGVTPNIACPTCVTNTTAQITRAQVTGQEGVDTGQNTSISALQVNDTYFNGTVYPNSTNFRNDSALQISTYSGNFPNTTVASKEATWDAKSTFMNVSVWGQSVLTSFVRFVAGSGITLTQSGTNITVSDSGTNATLTSHTAATGTSVHGLGNVSLLNTPLVDLVLENGSVFVKTSNTSYVLTNNASYVLTNNGSYVLTSNNSYVKTDNTSYVLVTNTSYVLTSNASYVLVTNTSYVLTNNASYVLTSNNSYVKTNNISYALTSNLTYPRAAISNGTSTNLTYSNTTGVFDLLLPTCDSKVLSTSTGFYCGTDQTSAFSFIVTGGATHTGSITATAGTGITFTDVGGVWTISSPAAGVTNTTVDPQSFNWSNGTRGTIDFNKYATNVTINLTSGANISGYLPDANLASTFVKTVGATSPCISTGGQNPSITCSGLVTNQTVNFYSGSAANLTGTLPNASIPATAANISTANTFTESQNIVKNQNDITQLVIQNSNNNAATAAKIRLLGNGLQTDLGYFPPTVAAGVGITAPSGFGAIISHGGVLLRGYTTGNNMMWINESGYIGIFNNSPSNIMSFPVGSSTKPIADTWLTYSTSNTKEVLYEADTDFVKVREELNNTPVYAWRRNANEPIRYGVVADDINTPESIVAFHDGKNNTLKSSPNAKPQGIDLGGYIGWLHEVVKSQAEQLQQQQKQIDSLEARVQKLENKINLTKP